MKWCQSVFCGQFPSCLTRAASASWGSWENVACLRHCVPQLVLCQAEVALSSDLLDDTICVIGPNRSFHGLWTQVAGM